MAAREQNSSPPSKRRKLDVNLPANTPVLAREAPSTSLARPISPPLTRRRRSLTLPPSPPQVQASAHVTAPPSPSSTTDGPKEISLDHVQKATTRYVRSPVQLTRIRDLGAEKNVDAVRLGDLLGDPMIRECWNFNFLFDLEWLMTHFDPDVRDSVGVRIVHGFWKREDERRVDLVETAERYPNVQTISAYMPDPFGTHHSKMLILLRHDDLAQIVIHTANMIERDWGNMTQAVWRSPPLPLKPHMQSPHDSQVEPQPRPIGSGERFETDLLRYLGAYGKRLSDLTSQLVSYDFSDVRAAFLGSAPSRHKPSLTEPSMHTSFGWLGLKEILSVVPVQSSEATSVPPSIVVQVSSIATLGQNTTWLANFQSVLSTHSSETESASASKPSSKATSFFTKSSATEHASPITKTPTFNIIFPTADEIRTSLDGYDSGHSIHTRIQSAAQQKQLEYLRPLLRHWKHSPPAISLEQEQHIHGARRQALRGPAAPHIKTYIRFNDADQMSIDWAMVTSANLSKQAWGDVQNKKEEVWIQSWETGVVVWPQLYAESSTEHVVMVPVFGTDVPGLANEEVLEKEDAGKEQAVVGFRMPYDLPLTSYRALEVPWCATLAYEEPDWKGQSWSGYGR